MYRCTLYVVKFYSSKKKNQKRFKLEDLNPQDTKDKHKDDYVKLNKLK